MGRHNLAALSLAEAARWLQAGRCSSVDLVAACSKELARGAARGLNAWATVAGSDRLHQAAQDADARRAAGASLGKLDGVPVCVKDNFCEQGRPTQAGSRILEGFVPTYDATVVSRLRDAGAISMGSTCMDEFAMGSGSVYGCQGPVVNPWSQPEGEALVAGGSSGGSAVAVATGASYAGLGSDTGGSVRLPAAYCGIVGLKPTYGRVSRWGLIALASSLDAPSIFARTVEDAALVLDAVAGPDGYDSTALQSPCKVAELLEAGAGSLRGQRIGVPAEFAVEELSDEAVAVWDMGVQWLRDAGAEVVPVSIPSVPLALPAYYVITPAEAASNLACYDGVRYGQRAASTRDIDTEENSADALHSSYTATRSQGFGPEVQRRVMVGNYVLSESAREAYLGSAVAVRRALVAEFEAVWAAGVSAMLTPTCPTGPFPVAGAAEADPLGMYVNDVMTVAANLTGTPAISVPVALSTADAGATSLPLSLQLIGKHGDEATVCQLAQVLEARAEFADKVPTRVLSRA